MEKYVRFKNGNSIYKVKYYLGDIAYLEDKTGNTLGVKKTQVEVVKSSLEKEFEKLGFKMNYDSDISLQFVLDQTQSDLVEVYDPFAKLLPEEEEKWIEFELKTQSIHINGIRYLTPKLLEVIYRQIKALKWKIK